MLSLELPFSIRCSTADHQALFFAVMKQAFLVPFHGPVVAVPVGLGKVGAQFCAGHLSLIRLFRVKIVKGVLKPPARVIYKGIVVIRCKKALIHQNIFPVPDPAPGTVRGP